VKYPGHLFAEETVLQAAAEWVLDAEAWMFLHLRAGEACWIHPADPCLLNAGDTLVVPPRDRGIVRASLITTATLVHFRFCPDLLAGFLTLAERVQVEQAGKARRARTRVFHLNHPISRDFAAFCAFDGDKSGPVARSRLLQIAVRVLTQCSAVTDDEDAAFLPASKRAQLVFRQLSETELLEHSPAELARRCGCSVRHFNKLFRAHFGISLRVRQRELKLIKARQLLAETNMRVIEIATASGFRDQGMFSSAFKRRFGMTPGEWRRDGAADDPQSSHAATDRNGSS
jgi:AraC-like DNA-binding protein